MTPRPVSPDILTQKWYVTLNDEIGGWSVTTARVSGTSQLSSVNGDWIADGISEDVVRAIVDDHNRKLENSVVAEPSLFERDLDEVEIRGTFDQRKFSFRSLVPTGLSSVAYQLELRHMYEEVQRRLSEEGKATRIWSL